MAGFPTRHFAPRIGLGGGTVRTRRSRFATDVFLEEENRRLRAHRPLIGPRSLLRRSAAVCEGDALTCKWEEESTKCVEAKCQECQGERCQLPVHGRWVDDGGDFIDVSQTDFQAQATSCATSGILRSPPKQHSMPNASKEFRRGAGAKCNVFQYYSIIFKPSF